jgi:hypothetical protein
MRETTAADVLRRAALLHSAAAGYAHTRPSTLLFPGVVEVGADAHAPRLARLSVRAAALSWVTENLIEPFHIAVCCALDVSIENSSFVEVCGVLLDPT